MSGFGTKLKVDQVPVKYFYIEYKYTLPETEETLKASADDVEDLVKTVKVCLPVLRDAVLEEQWLMSLVQVFLSTEQAKKLNINQAFVFHYDPKKATVKDLILRMQTEQFTDEACQFLDSPDIKKVVNWRSQLCAKFKSLYNFPLDVWLTAQEKVTF